MHKVIEYQVNYDLEVDIRYMGEENPGEHYFKLHRHFVELSFDDEESEAKAVVFPDGSIEVEEYDGCYIRDVEEAHIIGMVKEILEGKKI